MHLYINFLNYILVHIMGKILSFQYMIFPFYWALSHILQWIFSTSSSLFNNKYVFPQFYSNIFFPNLKLIQKTLLFYLNTNSQYFWIPSKLLSTFLIQDLLYFYGKVYKKSCNMLYRILLFMIKRLWWTIKTNDANFSNLWINCGSSLFW